MPRNMVTSRKPTIALRRPVCAAHTAIAMVSDEAISTAVLTAPRVMSSSWLASAKPAMCGRR